MACLAVKEGLAGIHANGTQDPVVSSFIPSASLTSVTPSQTAPKHPTKHQQHMSAREA
jgi:hypothetical protein